MGILGPVIRAEVGDTINVTLRNSLLSHNISIQPHGVMYTKANEGEAYNDGTTGINTIWAQLQIQPIWETAHEESQTINVLFNETI